MTARVTAPLFLAVVLMIANTGPKAGATMASGSDAEDRVLWRSVVPDPARQHGEVRIVRRGTEIIVQTVIVTRLMKRAIREIEKKEERAWPEHTAGYEDARRYLRALEHARDLLWTRYGENGPGGDRRQRLLIEFSSAAASGLVVVAEPTTSGKPGFLRVTGRVSIERVPVSLHYATRDMRLIVADSFRISEDRAADLLGHGQRGADGLSGSDNEPPRRTAPAKRQRGGQQDVSPGARPSA